MAFLFSFQNEIMLLQTALLFRILTNFAYRLSNSWIEIMANKNLNKAKDLEHPLLGGRLREICQVLLELENDNPHCIFGSPDDMKLRSCMTLFDVVEPDSIFTKVLEKFFQGRRDRRTLTILKEQSHPINYEIIELE